LPLEVYFLLEGKFTGPGVCHLKLLSYRQTQILFALVSLALLGGCASNPSKPDFAANCSKLSQGSLVNYDRLSQQFLDTDTQNPSDNSGGGIVWGTRYYMEALLDAYEATGNPKYIQAFVTTGTAVMNGLQSLTVVNVADPSAPGSTIDSPTVSVSGWPTQLGSFSESVAIPTENGQTALYAQNLDPTDPNGPIYFQVSPAAGGGLTLSWVGATQTLASNTIHNAADLSALAAAPLIEGQSYARLSPTGLGLPAPGTYQVNSPIVTIWHEQTGGILLPFARFLVLAKSQPGLAPANTIAAWTSQVLSTATSYQEEFVPDPDGGLRLRNPIWLPNSTAGTNVAADYVGVEATMRMFLYVLTGDSAQLAIAQGLVTHQKNFHWQLNDKKWLLLKSWPCLITWSTRASAPEGAIWDQFSYDTTSPSTIEDGATYVDLFHQASVLGLASTLGITPDIYMANQRTLKEYLFADPYVVATRPAGLLRGSYPAATSAGSDPLTSSQYSYSSAWYVAPEVADSNYINANWNWMMRFSQNPQGSPIGYFLRAWAMSEAAELSICKAK
jgi:hypothetical protein